MLNKKDFLYFIIMLLVMSFVNNQLLPADGEQRFIILKDKETAQGPNPTWVSDDSGEKFFTWRIRNNPATLIATADDGAEIKIELINDYLEQVGRVRFPPPIYNWKHGIYDKDDGRMIAMLSIPQEYFHNYEDEYYDYTLNFRKVEEFQNVNYYELKLTLNDTLDRDKQNLQYIDSKKLLKDMIASLPEDSMVFDPNPDAQYKRELVEEYTIYFQRDLFFWVDTKNDGKYSGSFSYPAFPFTSDEEQRTLEAKEQYEALSDFLIYYANQQLDRFEYILQFTVTYTVPATLKSVIAYITVYDEEKGTFLKNRYDELLILREKVKVDSGLVRATQSRLLSFTTLVSQSPRATKSWDYTAPQKPDIVNDFPTTEDELDTYLKWMAMGYKSLTSEGGELCDAFGNPLRIQFIDKSIKAISSGADKEFGTKDDIWIIRYSTGAYDDYPLRAMLVINKDDLDYFKKIYNMELSF